MKILCLCTGNTCRSPMLAALLRDQIAKRGRLDEVESAGTSAVLGEPATDNAQHAMLARGIILSSHRSRPVQDLDITIFDRIVCMTSSHAAYARSMGVPPGRLEVANADAGGIPDPFGGDEEAYEACARILQKVAEQIVERIATEQK